MEDFRKVMAVICGSATLVFFITWACIGGSTSEWNLVKTYLQYNNETNVLEPSQTPQYYIILNTSGGGNSETDYLDLVNQDCRLIRINQPNKKFYNQAIFSKKKYFISYNGGVTTPENFNGYIQYGEKAYSLEEFYENPPFEGRRDPSALKNPFGWIALSLLLACALFALIPFEEYEFTLPFKDKIKKKKVEKAAIEIFSHLEHIFKVKKLKNINFSIEDTDWKICIDHNCRTMSITPQSRVDGIYYDYRTKEVNLHDKYGLRVALEFIKFKSKLQPLYNNILNYIVDVVVDKIPPADNIQITL